LSFHRLLCFETLSDTTLREVIIKSATDRARPLEGNGNGDFWDGAHGLINSGFPSGHSTEPYSAGLNQHGLVA
jgi:hypothetical protein